jgi:5-methylcytosine-specific restriction enzyme subunit McrC
MPVITLFEHQYRSYDELGLGLTRPLLEGIDQLNQNVGRDLVILHRKGIKATQFVGVIRVADITLQVLPKIDFGEKSNPDGAIDTEPHRNAMASATRNLLYLLSYTQDLKVYEQDIAALGKQKSDWLELLTRLLAADLHRLMQRGLVRNYIQVEDSLPMMRGRWRLEQQLIRRPHVKHRFEVLYDEFSPDVLLNQVFRYAVDFLHYQTQDKGNRRLLMDLGEWMTPVRKRVAISSAELDRVVFTRLNDRYRPAFNLARMFVENTTMTLSAGKILNFAFVFDMNVLFEEFVARFLQHHRQTIFPERWQDFQFRIQSEGKATHLAWRSSDNTSVFKLVPDVALENLAGKPLLILDTKYKTLDLEQRKMGVSEGDFYQMLAYLVRMNCDRGLILYPQSADGMSSRQFFQIEDQSGQVLVATINLRQPIEQTQALIQEFGEIFVHALLVPA